MKLMVVLMVLFAQQTLTANGLTTRLHQKKIRAILGDSIKYHLTSTTRELIQTRELIPPEVASLADPTYQAGRIMDIWDSWPTLLQDTARAIALHDLASSQKHLEEGRILLKEVHGDEYGEKIYKDVLDLIIIQKTINDVNIRVDKPISPDIKKAMIVKIKSVGDDLLE